MPGEINFGCSEEYAELCALATSGSLTAAEEERLEAHVAICSECALLLNQYRTLATAGMAQIAAMRADAAKSEQKLQNVDRLKSRLLAALPPSPAAQRPAAGLAARSLLDAMRASRVPAFVVLAALVLIAIGVGYLIGTSRAIQQTNSVMARSAGAEALLKARLAAAESQLTSTQEKLLVTSQASEALQTRVARYEVELKNLQGQRSALEARIETLSSDNQTQGALIASLINARDGLTQRLRDSEGMLQSVRQELKTAQDDRQRFLLRAATLETQVDHLSAQVRDADDAARRHEQYLASDRDVRELMGARQLYIADVFDVDSHGKTRTPFGRVFYTKGKSLIFYAFDLDQQTGYRDAKAFQAWGRGGSSHATPISLGIFYLDSEMNRRWALKFDDPKVLEEINALFVTVEPKGGSKHPTNKPFLLAYLRTATPNHP